MFKLGRYFKGDLMWRSWLYPDSTVGFIKSAHRQQIIIYILTRKFHKYLDLVQLC